MKLAPATPELPVQNVRSAQEHYRDVLGFDISWHHEVGRIGAVAHGDCAIFFREGREVRPHVLWVFVEDVDAARAALAAKGANVTAELSDTPWGLRQFTVQDLDGHSLHFHHDL